MPSTVRRATATDIPRLVQMMQAFYAESDYPLDLRWASASFVALLDREDYGAIWIVTDEGLDAGYVVLTVRFSMEYGGLSGFIDDLFVLPKYRRRGLGQIALEALMAECQRRQVLAVHVEVAPDNMAAKALYARHGLRLQDDGRQTLTLRFA